MVRAQMNRTMLPVMTGHYASGTSSYTVLQYAQGVKHSEFVSKNLSQKLFHRDFQWVWLGQQGEEYATSWDGQASPIWSWQGQHKGGCSQKLEKKSSKVANLKKRLLSSGGTMIGWRPRRTCARLWPRWSNWSLTTLASLKDNSQVPTVVVNYQVPWRGWNHIDHLSSVDIDKYQNNYLLNLLEMYSNE